MLHCPLTLDPSQSRNCDKNSPQSLNKQGMRETCLLRASQLVGHAFQRDIRAWTSPLPLLTWPPSMASSSHDGPGQEEAVSSFSSLASSFPGSNLSLNHKQSYLLCPIRETLWSLDQLEDIFRKMFSLTPSLAFKSSACCELCFECQKLNTNSLSL